MNTDVINIGLLSHYFEHENLGCVALSISNVKLLDEVAERCNKRIHYKILTTDNQKQVPLDFTSNTYEYLIYPRSKQSLRHPIKLLKSKVFNDCDFIANLCAGDGFTDIYGFLRVIAESYTTILANKKGTKVIFSPQTIGPFNKWISRVIATEVLNNVEMVFARDSLSSKCCDQLNAANKTLEVIDVAFALPYKKNNFNTKQFKVGINVSGLLYNGGYNRKNYFGLSFDYADFINKLIPMLIEKNVDVHLVSHVISKENVIEDDYRICEDLAKKYPKATLAPKFKSPIEAKSYISGLDLFSGARMHATIASISSGVPVIPIAYSRKFNGLYQTLEYPYIIDAKDDNVTIEKALDCFMRYMDEIELLEQRVTNSIQIYTDRLRKYTDNVENIIKKKA